MKSRIILAVISAAVCIPALGKADEPEVQKDTLSEAVVTGTRSALDLRQLSSTVNVIGRDAIEESKRSSLLPLLTEQVPGLFVTSRGIMGYGVSGGAAGNISMRGMSGSAARFLVLIDGHPQYAGIFGHPIADSYQSMMAQRVEVLRGPASLIYGSDAMGGVINIVTRKQQQDGITTNVHLGYGLYNTVESEVSNAFKKGKLSTFASLSYNRTDGHRQNMGFQQYGGIARIGYEFTQNWKMSADVNVTHFDASQPGPVSAPLIDADQKITRGVASVLVENNYGITSGGISVFYNFGHHWINDGYSEGSTPKMFRFVSYDDMMGTSLYQSAQLFKGNLTTFGLDFYRYAGKADNVFVDGPKQGTKELQVDKSEYELAAYVDFRQKIQNWLTLNAGLRVDHHFTSGTQFIPQAGLNFHVPYHIEIKTTASKGFRYPTIREMYMYPPQNPDLKAESLWNFEVAFSQTLLDGKLRYGVNVFQILAKNIILTLPNPSGAGKLNQNSGELNNTGVEAEVSYKINSMWAVNTNYSYLHMVNPVVAAPEHKLYLGGSFTKGIWHASLGAQYVNGLYKSTDPVQKENFFLLNARFSVQALKWLNVWINGDNLTATQYEINAGYPMPRASFMLGVNLSFDCKKLK